MGREIHVGGHKIDLDAVGLPASISPELVLRGAVTKAGEQCSAMERRMHQAIGENDRLKEKLAIIEEDNRQLRVRCTDLEIDNDEKYQYVEKLETALRRNGLVCD